MVFIIFSPFRIEYSRDNGYNAGKYEAEQAVSRWEISFEQG